MRDEAHAPNLCLAGVELGDIGGGTPRAGLPGDDSWPRRTESWFTSRQYALISPWDTTNQIANLTHQIQDNHPNHDTTHLAAALLLHAYLHPTNTLTSN